MGRCCCHGHNKDYSKMTIDFDQEPVKKDDGTYEIEVGSVTAIDDRSVAGWGKLVGMHACSIAAMACLGGLCMGLLAGHIINRLR